MTTPEQRCIICGGITLISSLTGARVHALSPKSPHNVQLPDPAPREES